MPPPAHPLATPSCCYWPFFLASVACPKQVEQSGRLPSHTFLDYTLTYLLFAASTALTLGQLGPASVSTLGQSLNFLDQLQQDNWQLVMFALAGGACLALGGEGGHGVWGLWSGGRGCRWRGGVGRGEDRGKG
jgi:hypothetical protein